MNAVLYARVSTDKQAEKELSIPAQLQAMRDYARQHEWMVTEEFLEPGASARTTDRPMLQRLLARCREAPKIDVVLVHKVDRLARDVYGHATIKTMLKQRGIRLASVVENVDDSITGQLVEHIMASIAEYYSANLGEEVKKGMRVMVRRGEWPHLPPRGYRQTRTNDNRPLAVADEVEAPAIREAFELYATGRFALNDIGEELLIRGIATSTGKRLPNSYVRGMLENPFYAGRLRWNGADYPAKHSAIVSEALFARVERTLRYRFKTPGERGRVRYLMRGVATCGGCGYKMTAERKKRWAYYRCVKHTRGECRAPFSNVETAHQSLRQLYERLRLPDALKQEIREEARTEIARRVEYVENDKVVLERRRERLIAREIKLTGAFTEGNVSERAYKTLADRLRADIGVVDDALKQSGPVPENMIENIDRLLDFASSVRQLHNSLDLVRQQRLLGILFSRITLDRGAITDFELRPPFGHLFGGDAPEGPPSGSSSPQSEQRTVTPAIKSLFGFDFSALEGLLPSSRALPAVPKQPTVH